VARRPISASSTLYELDKSIPERYVGWLGDAVTGDLGTATSQGQRPVSEILPGSASATR
jgi:ABC-type dipeptide/oligopeptide/nickel transport system permease component